MPESWEDAIAGVTDGLEKVRRIKRRSSELAAEVAVKVSVSAAPRRTGRLAASIEGKGDEKGIRTTMPYNYGALPAARDAMVKGRDAATDTLEKELLDGLEGAILG